MCTSWPAGPCPPPRTRTIRSRARRLRGFKRRRRRRRKEKAGRNTCKTLYGGSRRSLSAGYRRTYSTRRNRQIFFRFFLEYSFFARPGPRRHRKPGGSGRDSITARRRRSRLHCLRDTTSSIIHGSRWNNNSNSVRRRAVFVYRSEILLALTKTLRSRRLERARRVYTIRTHVHVERKTVTVHEHTRIGRVRSAANSYRRKKITNRKKKNEFRFRYSITRRP